MKSIPRPNKLGADFVMDILLAFIGVPDYIGPFLLGLWNWAVGGAFLWRIFRITHGQKSMSHHDKLEADKQVRSLELSADRAVSSAFRIISGLAVAVWLVLGLTLILDFFGINWAGYMYSRAKSYWSAPGSQSQQSTQSRNDTLRNMGSSFRR